MIAFTNGNVIRLKNLINGNRIALHEDGYSDTVLEDSLLIEENGLKDKEGVLNLDGNLGLLLEDTDTTSIRTSQQHNHHISLKHFARHGLCGNSRGKTRFYLALKSKFCQTTGTFVYQLVEDLCGDIANCKHSRRQEDEECGKNLYRWVAEIFDLNGDKHVDHFERHFYDHNLEDK